MPQEEACVLWISEDGEPQVRSLCQPCGFRMDIYFLTEPQFNLVWFCGFLQTYDRK
jgi:hypothetical protein